MSLIADLLWTIYALVRGAFDALLGRRRKRYSSSIDIAAPLDTVWTAASAHEIVFDGPPRIEVATALRPGTSDTYDGTVSVGGRVMPMAYREIEMKPPNGLVIEILEQGSAPNVALGADYYVACTLERIPEGTRLTIVHELTHKSFAGRILVPVGARQNSRRLRDYCEELAGTAKRPTSKLRAALITGALTYASFTYLFDWRFAAVLLGLLVVHEAGHAIAMRWVGLPVQGVYFIPFFGGIAVAAAPHRSEAERGFVALMGPGFSLITTGAFLFAAFATGDPLFEQLALVSAILNGLNLAPVLPLDGGQVTDAALSGSDPEFAAIISMLALIVGVGVSVYFQWHVLTVLLLLTVLALRGARKRPRRTEPISAASRNWLVAGYVATVAFYVAVVARYMS